MMAITKGQWLQIHSTSSACEPAAAWSSDRTSPPAAMSGSYKHVHTDELNDDASGETCRG